MSSKGGSQIVTHLIGILETIKYCVPSITLIYPHFIYGLYAYLWGLKCSRIKVWQRRL